MFLFAILIQRNLQKREYKIAITGAEDQSAFFYCFVLLAGSRNCERSSAAPIPMWDLGLSAKLCYSVSSMLPVSTAFTFVGRVPTKRLRDLKQTDAAPHPGDLILFHGLYLLDLNHCFPLWWRILHSDQLKGQPKGDGRYPAS